MISVQAALVVEKNLQRILPAEDWVGCKEDGLRVR